jgi:hypothetical protein
VYENVPHGGARVVLRTYLAFIKECSAFGKYSAFNPLSQMSHNSTPRFKMRHMGMSKLSLQEFEIV